MNLETLPDRFAAFLEALCRFESAGRTLAGFSTPEFQQAALDAHNLGESFSPGEFPIVIGALGGMWATYALSDESVIHTEEIVDRAKSVLTGMLGEI